MVDGAMLLYSGGLDSTVCLHWTKKMFTPPYFALFVNYGQRHAYSEMQSVTHLAQHNNFKLIVFDFRDMLTGGLADGIRYNDKVASPVVPCRNLLLLALATNAALHRGIKTLVTGVCLADRDGFPDCGPSFIEAASAAIRMGLEQQQRDIHIHTPLMGLSKKETLEMALSMPGCLEDLGYTHTCYNGIVGGCGACRSCVTRAEGFKAAGIVDPLCNVTPK